MKQDLKKIEWHVIHCSATRPNHDIGVKEINQWHEAPCDIKDKNGHVTGVRYHRKIYGSRLALPKHELNGIPIINLTGRGWWDPQAEMGCGYHIIVRLDGSAEVGRPINIVGAHVHGFNIGSLATVYIGGLDKLGNPKDTRTDAQKKTLKLIDEQWKDLFHGIKTRGHRDFSPDIDGDGVIEPFEWMKACPCFDVKKEFGS